MDVAVAGVAVGGHRGRRCAREMRSAAVDQIAGCGCAARPRPRRACTCATLAQRARELAPRGPQPVALAAVARDEHVERAGLGQRVAARARPGARARLRRRRARSAAARRARASSGSRPAAHERRACARRAARGSAATTPRRNTAPTARPAAGRSGQQREQRRDRRRAWAELERDLGDHAERALAADDQRGEVVAGDALDRALAELRARSPVGGHDLEPEHVVARRRRSAARAGRRRSRRRCRRARSSRASSGSGG